MIISDVKYRNYSSTVTMIDQRTVVQYGKVRVNAGMVNHFTVSLFGLIEKCIWKITLSIQLKAPKCPNKKEF